MNLAVELETLRHNRNSWTCHSTKWLLVGLSSCKTGVSREFCGSFFWRILMCGPSIVSTMETDGPEDLCSVRLIVIDGRKDGVYVSFKTPNLEWIWTPEEKGKIVSISCWLMLTRSLQGISKLKSEQYTTCVGTGNSISISFCLCIHPVHLLSSWECQCLCPGGMTPELGQNNSCSCETQVKTRDIRNCYATKKYVL